LQKLRISLKSAAIAATTVENIMLAQEINNVVQKFACHEEEMLQDACYQTVKASGRESLVTIIRFSNAFNLGEVMHMYKSACIFLREFIRGVIG